MKKKIETLHGDIRTPFFMPDATRGVIRGIPMKEVNDIGIEAMCMNTYHLMLRPGVEIIKNAGGIHAFTGWDGPILTDSGGYQVFSLIHKNPKLGEITEYGARFRDIYTGHWKMLTPEESVRIQSEFGVDMMVILDDVRPNDRDKNEIEDAVYRTIRWAKRAWREYKNQWKEKGWTKETRPKIFAVIQGGPYIDLRKKCFEGLQDVGEWDGYGFGGLHIDERGNLMKGLVKFVADLIPDDKLKFALGVGTPGDIVEFINAGWDMFDCTIPTRDGRHGKGFVGNFENIDVLNLKNSKCNLDFSSIEDGCDCGCAEYSRSLLNHLFKIGDSSVGVIISRHNLRKYTKFFADNKR